MCSHHCLDCKVKVIIYSESLGFHNKENISEFKKSYVIYIEERLTEIFVFWKGK